MLVNAKPRTLLGPQKKSTLGIHVTKILIKGRNERQMCICLDILNTVPLYEGLVSIMVSSGAESYWIFLANLGED